MLDLTDKGQVLDYVAGQLPSESRDALETLLEQSAGYRKADCSDAEEEAVKTYRPWWVIGNALDANPNAFQSARSAAGSQVVYRDRSEAVRAMMRRQSAMDAQLCEVPFGFEAIAPAAAGSARIRRSYG